MNKEKIKDFIEAYSKALDLNTEIKDTLNELIPKLVDKYSNTIEYVPVSKDDYDKYIIKPMEGKYSLEDFFLNRLMNSVMKVEFVNFEHDGEKGSFKDETHEISFNEAAINKQLKGRLPVDTKNVSLLQDIARKKVIMHEFEHALQTQYEKNREIYPLCKNDLKKIIHEISNIKGGRYAQNINSYKDIETRPQKVEGSRNTLHCGLKQRGKRTEEIDNLNEIFNETESLEMSNAQVQMKYRYNDGTYYNVRNYESSNWMITNYGELTKLLLGDKTTFRAMYVEPDIAIQQFNNRYGDIFKEKFNNDKTAWENLIGNITDIKKQTEFYENKLKPLQQVESYSKEEIEKIKSLKLKSIEKSNLDLQEVLALCFEKKIENSIESAKKEELMEAIEKFKDNSIWSENRDVRNSLKHVQILKSIREKVIGSDKGKDGQGVGLSQTQVRYFNDEEEKEDREEKVQEEQSRRSNSFVDSLKNQKQEEPRKSNSFKDSIAPKPKNEISRNVGQSIKMQRNILRVGKEDVMQEQNAIAVQKQELKQRNSKGYGMSM